MQYSVWSINARVINPGRAVWHVVLEVAQHQLVSNNRITDLYIHTDTFWKIITGVRVVVKEIADNWILNYNC